MTILCINWYMLVVYQFLGANKHLLEKIAKYFPIQWTAFNFGSLENLMRPKHLYWFETLFSMLKPQRAFPLINIRPYSLGYVKTILWIIGTWLLMPILKILTYIKIPTSHGFKMSIYFSRGTYLLRYWIIRCLTKFELLKKYKFSVILLLILPLYGIKICICLALILLCINIYAYLFIQLVNKFMKNSILLVFPTICFLIGGCLIYTYRFIKFCLYGLIFIVLRIILTCPIIFLIGICLWFICIKERSLYLILHFWINDLMFPLTYFETSPYSKVNGWILPLCQYFNHYFDWRTPKFRFPDQAFPPQRTYAVWIMQFTKMHFSFSTSAHWGNAEWGWEVPVSNRFVHNLKIAFKWFLS